MATKITKIIANFDTQLASTINVASVTGFLRSPVLDDDNVQAPDGKYVMCMDLGTSKEEHLLFDLVGLTGAMTNIKHVSKQGVETVGANIQHRTGAKVSLTNFANLLYISKLLTGEVPLDGSTPLIYDIPPVFTLAVQLVSKGYVDAQDALALATILAGNNLFTGINTFTGKTTFSQSPAVPAPLLGSEAVNYATVLSIAMGSASIVAGYTDFDVKLDSLGRIDSVTDNVINQTYFIKYRADDPLIPYYIDTVDTYVLVNYDGSGILAGGRKY